MGRLLGTPTGTELGNSLGYMWWGKRGLVWVTVLAGSLLVAKCMASHGNVVRWGVMWW